MLIFFHTRCRHTSISEGSAGLLCDVPQQQCSLVQSNGKYRCVDYSYEFSYILSMLPHSYNYCDAYHAVRIYVYLSCCSICSVYSYNNSGKSGEISEVGNFMLTALIVLFSHYRRRITTISEGSAGLLCHVPQQQCPLV